MFDPGLAERVEAVHKGDLLIRRGLGVKYGPEDLAEIG